MSIARRIRAAREYAGFDQAKLGRRAGVSQQAVQKWEKNGVSSTLRLAKIACVCGVNFEWLSTGRGEMTPTTLARTNARDSAVMLRQYNDVAGSMGDGVTLRDQPGQITEWMVTPEWVNKNIPTNSGKQNLRIVTGFGDSMRGMFNSGDPLIVDIGVKSVEYDAVYFFRVGNEGFIKRLQRVPGKGLLAISENKAYESWPITDDMDFECFGRVLKAWKSEEF